LKDEDPHASLAELAEQQHGRATIAMAITALAAMLPFLYIEAATIANFGRAWFVAQNVVDALTYVNQVSSPCFLTMSANLDRRSKCSSACSLGWPQQMCFPGVYGGLLH
jgi:prophage antirepressor-like protein